MVISPPPNTHASRDHQIQHLESFIFDDQLAQFGTLATHPATCFFPREREIEPLLVRVGPTAAGTCTAARILRVRLGVEVILAGELAGALGGAPEDSGRVEVSVGFLGEGCI